jgi:hypothetical protein
MTTCLLKFIFTYDLQNKRDSLSVNANLQGFDRKGALSDIFHIN